MSLATWQNMESRITGEKEISLERLKSISSCNTTNSEHEKRFWRVFESFSNEERQAYLKFVWGRTRLPEDLSNLSHKHEVRIMDNMSKTGFP